MPTDETVVLNIQRASGVPALISSSNDAAWITTDRVCDLRRWE